MLGTRASSFSHEEIFDFDLSSVQKRRLLQECRQDLTVYNREPVTSDIRVPGYVRLSNPQCLSSSWLNGRP